MTIQELETLGYYEPGLLHLRINTDFEISDLNLMINNDRKLFSTFLHEYIHFLQDVTTTTGLTYAAFYISLIKDVNWNIINDGKSEFEVPYQFNNDFNTLTQLQLRDVYQGNKHTEDYAKYDIYKKENIEILDKDNNILNLRKYKIFYYDKDRNYKSFYFGITCLNEYVAHKIQKTFCDEVEHPDIPYFITELIVSKECPEFGQNNNNILALCDACLMCYHPADMFFATLEKIQKVNFVPKTIQEVYDFVYNDLKFRRDDVLHDINSLYEETLNITINEFQNALQSPIFQSNFNWITQILNVAKNWRQQNRGFITNLLDDNGNLSTTFFSILHDLGTPFFTNNLSKGGFIPPRKLSELPIQPFQLLVFKQIIDVYKGSTKCSLYEFCNSNEGEKLTNELCLTAPWKRGIDENLCPFGQLWKTWALNNEVPIPREKN